MATTVEITLDDDGNISVGLSDSPASAASDMQPAKSLGDALAMARHLLSQGASDAMGQGSDIQSGNGQGGGTGPDTDGSMVRDDTQDGGSDSSGKGQDAQALWDALANVNLPQN